ncbi:MAG: DNA repair protein RecO [Spirochaetales bacterium]|nr:DNA repair protein RecO [Spirochaetales bacterium]MCF7938227.1 DNA repair protein RecO [Spirochaetales bacterium]
MGRNRVSETIVLKSHQIGEIHKGVVLFSRNHGLISAIAHGAARPKGRLLGAVGQFTYSRSYFYHDPVKDQYTLKDAEVIEVFSRLRKNLHAFAVASASAELFLRTYGGGEDPEPAFALLLGVLYGIEEAEGSTENFADEVLVQFIWRFLGLLGMRPDPAICADCGRGMDEKDPRFCVPESGGFVCPDCAEDYPAVESSSPLQAGAVKYLIHTRRLSMREALRVGLEQKTLAGLRNVLLELVQYQTEVRLKSLRILEAGL